MQVPLLRLQCGEYSSYRAFYPREKENNLTDSLFPLSTGVNSYDWGRTSPHPRLFRPLRLLKLV